MLYPTELRARRSCRPVDLIAYVGSLCRKQKPLRPGTEGLQRSCSFLRRLAVMADRNGRECVRPGTLNPEGRCRNGGNPSTHRPK